MDDLILRYLNGEATDVEERRLEKWREDSSENQARYQEAQALWAAMGRIETPRAGTQPDARAMMIEAERRRARSRASRSRRAVLRSPWMGYGLATAATLALAFVGAQMWSVQRESGAALTTVESVAGPSGMLSMTLSDGTFVRVAEGAKVDFPSATGRREVVLAGKAFFAVATDESNAPFIVRTAAGEVRVHGTRFEVRAEASTVQVIVVEGVVRVLGPGGETEVRAGQVGTLDSDGVPRVLSVEDVWSLLSWPDGLLAFQDTPLADVANQLEWHFGATVRFGDSLAATRRVTGSFSDNSLADVVEALCAVTGIRCDQGENSVTLGAPVG